VCHHLILPEELVKDLWELTSHIQKMFEELFHHEGAAIWGNRSDTWNSELKSLEIRDSGIFTFVHVTLSTSKAANTRPAKYPPIASELYQLIKQVIN